MLAKASPEVGAAVNGTARTAAGAKSKVGVGAPKDQADQVSSQLLYFCGYSLECRENSGPQSVVKRLNIAMANVDK